MSSAQKRKIESQPSPLADFAPLASARDDEAPKTTFWGGVTRRAILLALLLMPANAYWIMQMELIRYSGHPTTISVFFNVVFWIVLLTLLNQILKRVLPQWAFSQGELLTIYLMLSIASAVAGHDFIEILVSYIGHCFQFARPENRWAELFLPFLPRWLVMSNPEALQGLYQGETSLYHWKFLLAWSVPVFAWTFFISLLLWLMLCMNVLLRQRWIESERLTYPLVQLPLEMTDPKLSLYRNRLFWIGFLIAGSIDLINGLAFWFPSVPSIPVRVQNITPFSQRPWSAIGWMTLSFYPFVIGLGILLPVDLLFSCWFFFFFWKAQRIIANAFAWDVIPQFPFINEQSFAGYIGLALFALWTGREHWLEVIKSALGFSSKVEDSGEPWRYRTAFLGLILGSLLLILFCLIAGMSLWVTVVFFTVYTLLSIAITRIRAELGPPAHDLHNGGPDVFLVDVAGTKALGVRNLGMFSLFYFFNRAYRAHPMPFQLEGFKIAERARMNAQRLGLAMLMAGAFGSLCAFWAFLHIGYRIGAGSAKVVGPVLWAFGPEPWNRLQSWLQTPQGTNYPALIAMGVGLIFTLTLMALRMRFDWWPFHPVGYAVSSSWSLHIIWCPLLIAWVIKLFLLRYGGLRLYRQSLPFFFGLILGEFIVGSLWTLIGIILGIPSYGFWV